MIDNESLHHHNDFCIKNILFLRQSNTNVNISGRFIIIISDLYVKQVLPWFEIAMYHFKDTG